MGQNTVNTHDPTSAAMLYAQTQVLAQRIDHTNHLLEKLAKEIAADRKETKLLAKRQQQIILWLTVSFAVAVTAALGPERLINALL